MATKATQTKKTDQDSSSWKIFHGDNRQPSHSWQTRLPNPPPWRTWKHSQPLSFSSTTNEDFISAEKNRAMPFRPSTPMIMAVNTALYLRRPLLLTGKPGTGKSTLISKVAYELKLGPVLRWPITSRSTVRGGVYNYDAVARLQSGDKHAPVSDYLALGPLGTALASTTWPRALLIDEIDKSDLDFANDLLNVIEEGVYEIPELSRLKDAEAAVKDAEGKVVDVRRGLLQCGQFPFVVMTSNAEREFPPPFLRRCVRLDIEKPKDKSEVEAIVKSHLKTYFTRTGQDTELETMIGRFLQAGDSNQEIATDQLLNAVFLTIGLNDPERRTFDPKELEQLRDTLLRPLGS